MKTTFQKKIFLFKIKNKNTICYTCTNMSKGREKIKGLVCRISPSKCVGERMMAAKTAYGVCSEHGVATW